MKIVVAENDIWMSQFDLSVLFKSSIKTINEHTSAIALTHEVKRVFDIEKIEGTRRVQRKVIHFGLDVSHEIAIRNKRWPEYNWLIDTAQFYGVTTTRLLVRPVKQHQFEELLFGVLDGLCEIHKQYPAGKYVVDFYIPSHHLVIEYDEKHHLKPNNQIRDRQREFEISSILVGTDFIRVQEGREIHGINLVVRRLMSGIATPGSQQQSVD